MDLLKKLFPISWKYKSEAKDLVIGIIIYLVAGIIGGVLLGVAGLFTGIPVLGAILGILLRAIGALLDIYVVAGIVIEVLLFAKVLKD
jgi:hypothetical protein